MRAGRWVGLQSMEVCNGGAEGLESCCNAPALSCVAQVMFALYVWQAVLLAADAAAFPGGTKSQMRQFQTKKRASLPVLA